MFHLGVHHRRMWDSNGKIINCVVISTPFPIDLAYDFFFFVIRVAGLGLIWLAFRSLQPVLIALAVGYPITQIYRRKYYLRRKLFRDELPGIVFK